MKKGSGKDNRKVYHTLTNFDELNHVSGADNMTFKKRITAITVDEAKKEITNQMEVEGLRERTIKEYIKWFDGFTFFTGATYVHQFTKSDIYDWLQDMDVSDNTRQIRLKALKALLNRMYDNNWIEDKFWKNLRIKIDQSQKEGTTPEQFQQLLNVLDLTSYFDLRLATGALIMYKAGFRTSTLAKLRESHIDFNNNVFKLSGDIMKNRQVLLLPFDKQLRNLMKILINENKKIRKFNGVNNDFVFIGRLGETIYRKGNSTVIQKDLYKVAKDYQIKNINPHSLRRGFAMNLRSQGADVVLISKALGHKSLEVTTQYLGIDAEEVVTSLRGFL